MAIDLDIRDQAYQFFAQEALELLHTIETELLALAQERTTARVHNLMRAAHSIKGGSASVGLEDIKELAHHLETFFGALHHPDLVLDVQLQSLLMEAFDCLQEPLVAEFTQGSHEVDHHRAQALFNQLTGRLGDYMAAETYLPSAADLGVDVAAAIFTVDVAQGLERLAAILDQQPQAVLPELRTQAEVFLGIAELLNLPGFREIAETTLQALAAHPDHSEQIARQALDNFWAAHQAVLAGDRTRGGEPSEQLTAWLKVPDPVTPSLWGEQWGDTEIADAADLWAVEALEAEPWSVSPQEQSALLDSIFTEEGEDAQLGSEEGPQEIDTLTDHPFFAEDFGPQELDPPQLGLEADNFPLGEPATIIDHPFAWFQGPEPDSLPEPATLLEQPFATAPEPQGDPATLLEESGESLAPPEYWAAEIQGVFESLPPAEPTPVPQTSQVQQKYVHKPQGGEETVVRTTLRVDLDRLERMNNLVGELVISRNGLSLRHDQMSARVANLLKGFERFNNLARQLQTMAETETGRRSEAGAVSNLPSFDTLELDNYSSLQLLLQEALEEVAQLSEVAADITLVSDQSNQALARQRQMLGQLQKELLWSRMLPLDDILRRFPRTLHDLSLRYDKPVDLKLIGTGVLVDRAVLERLQDPLLHLLRNAFDHGIEPPEVRQAQGKPATGRIEIRAYHQGNQTVIEIADDGQGVNLERVKERAIELNLIRPDQDLAPKDILDLLFLPGFSTAARVSELSGRGMGLDVVRFELEKVKGTVTLNFVPGGGTRFVLRIPLTLTIAKLLICFGGSSPFALPSDNIQEIILPREKQIKLALGQRFLTWQEQLVPIYALRDLVNYPLGAAPAPPSPVLSAVPAPKHWSAPLLLIRQGSGYAAVEVDSLVTEEELVIKPFGLVIRPPDYLYGCTILGDGTLVPVVDVAHLTRKTKGSNPNPSKTPRARRPQLATVLVADDSITVRQTLALTLERFGYRVLQARDGREALAQLQQHPEVQLVVSDVEMPNMNGFEFLVQRRQNPALSQIPVVMLTSRGADKHRQLAGHLGAAAYLTKPYLEGELLSTLGGLLGSAVP